MQPQATPLNSIKAAAPAAGPAGTSRLLAALKRTTYFFPAVGLVAVCLVMIVTTENFFSADNFLNIARQVSINAIIAVGMTCAILSGGIDLAVGSVMALSGTLMAGLMVAGVPPYVAILLGLGVGLAFGLFNGFFIAYADMPPIIVTLATMGIAYFGDTLDLTQMSEVEIAQAGIGRKFQKPTVFEALSVFENLELAQKANKSVWASLRARLSGEQKERIDEVLQTIRLEASRHRPAGLLSHGQKQFLEIGMLLMQEPHLLLLDEPVAGMTDAETEFTAELFKSLARQHALMVVEHDMGFVGSIADHVSVLHQGRVLAEGSLEQVQNDERVIEVYLGR